MWVKHRNWTKDLPNTRRLLNQLTYKWQTYWELIYVIFLFFHFYVACFLLHSINFINYNGDYIGVNT